MAENNFDIDMLISTIQSKESIWNYKSPPYSDKVQRKKDWTAVCAAMVPDFENKSKTDKNTIITELQGKWKVLRDGFRRNIRVRRRHMSEAGATKTRLYAYYDQLKFLKGLTEERTTRYFKNHRTTYRPLQEVSKEELGMEEVKPKIPKQDTKPKITPPISVSTPQPETPTAQQVTISSEDILIDKLSQAVGEIINTTKERHEEDEDKQFLMSLLNDFKKIDEDYKLDAKCDIINTIKHYRNISVPQSQSSTNPVMQTNTFTVTTIKEELL